MVSIWELAIKSRFGNLRIAKGLRTRITSELGADDSQVLLIELEQTLAVHELPDLPEHKDPFDRLLQRSPW